MHGKYYSAQMWIGFAVIVSVKALGKEIEPKEKGKEKLIHKIDVTHCLYKTVTNPVQQVRYISKHRLEISSVARQFLGNADEWNF